MQGIKKVCIIGQGTIASNPRLVKEALALSEAGYQVHLIYTRHVDYLLKTDQAILDQNSQWNADYLDWSGNTLRSKWIRLISGLKKRILDILLKIKLLNWRALPLVRSRFYKWQLKKALAAAADLYIAHYPESVAVAANAARINKSLFAFDAEDFHRGESLPKTILKSIEVMENSYLASASYISAASPLIAAEYRKLFPRVPVISIENMFFLKDQPLFQNLQGEIIKFFWFSQTIGPKRGLEEFIVILGKTGKKEVQLSLLGNVNPGYRRMLCHQWQNEGLNTDKLVFIPPVPEKEIFNIAAMHHFGLALETPHSHNRDICLTNKIYTYILSGSYLILSKTRAQKNFHAKYPQTGICLELDKPAEAACYLAKLIDGPSAILPVRKYNYQKGTEALNFDLEKNTLLKQVGCLRI